MDRELRIGIDLTAHLTHPEAKSGQLVYSASIYIADILDGLCRNGHAGQITIFTYRWAETFLKTRFPGVRIVCVGNRVCDAVNSASGKNLYRKFNMNANIVRTINACDVDLVWNPFLSTRLKQREIQHRTIATVHDFIDYSKAEQAAGFRQAVISASCVMTISEYVKRDCARVFCIPEDRIIVIPNAVRVSGIREEPVPDLAPGYILDVNGFHPHKNTITLIRAFDRIGERTDCTLVLCGGGRDDGYYAELLREIETRQLKNRVRVIYQATDAQVEWLYNHARLFANPSLKEGFGRGPIEAALRCVPVLTSGETALYESTMGLLEYMTDPKSDEAMAGDLLRVLTDGVSYDMQRAKEKYLKAYAPETVAAACWETFEKAAGDARQGND